MIRVINLPVLLKYPSLVNCSIIPAVFGVRFPGPGLAGEGCPEAGT